MKKTLITLTIMLAAAALVIVFCGPAMAKVTGRCDNCHTMHNSQGGTAMASGGPHGTLLMDSCVGCHSSSSSSTISNAGGCPTPVVNYTGSGEPTTHLAGGNFWWVATGKGGRDAAGHNVLGISGVDAITLAGKFAPGGFACGDNDCHTTLAKTPSNTFWGPGGCQGCHLAPAHHADDTGPVVGAATPSTDGYYRFLSAHNCSAGGVCGIEDPNWQATADATNHNEYLGNEVNLTTSANMGSLGNTMTGFCCGCHGNFHKEQNASGEWIRHPSDAKIPITGEYAAYVLYDPLAPVARPDLTDWIGPSSSVNKDGTVSKDMVMCLSCHRPHGSPNDDLLRWDYAVMLAGGGDSTTGCFACHTKKDTGG